MSENIETPDGDVEPKPAPDVAEETEVADAGVAASEAPETKSPSRLRRLFDSRVARGAVAIALLTGVFRLTQISNEPDNNQKPQAAPLVIDSLSPDVLQDIKDLRIQINLLPESDMDGQKADVHNNPDGSITLDLLDEGDQDAIRANLEGMIGLIKFEKSAPALTPDGFK